MALKKKQQHVPEPAKKAVFDPNKNSKKMGVTKRGSDEPSRI